MPDSPTNPACDGWCAPDECVCPDAERRAEEIREHVAMAERRIVAWLRSPEAGELIYQMTNGTVADYRGDIASMIERGEHRG